MVSDSSVRWELHGDRWRKNAFEWTEIAIFENAPRDFRSPCAGLEKIHRSMSEPGGSLLPICSSHWIAAHIPLRSHRVPWKRPVFVILPWKPVIAARRGEMELNEVSGATPMSDVLVL